MCVIQTDFHQYRPTFSLHGGPLAHVRNPPDCSCRSLASSLLVIPVCGISLLPLCVCLCSPACCITVTGTCSALQAHTSSLNRGRQSMQDYTSVTLYEVMYAVAFLQFSMFLDKFLLFKVEWELVPSFLTLTEECKHR